MLATLESALKDARARYPAAIFTSGHVGEAIAEARNQILTLAALMKVEAEQVEASKLSFPIVFSGPAVEEAVVALRQSMGLLLALHGSATAGPILEYDRDELKKVISQLIDGNSVAFTPYVVEEAILAVRQAAHLLQDLIVRRM